MPSQVEFPSFEEVQFLAPCQFGCLACQHFLSILETASIARFNSAARHTCSLGGDVTGQSTKTLRDLTWDVSGGQSLKDALGPDATLFQMALVLVPKVSSVVFFFFAVPPPPPPRAQGLLNQPADQLDQAVGLVLSKLRDLQEAHGSPELRTASPLGFKSVTGLFRLYHGVQRIETLLAL